MLTEERQAINVLNTLNFLEDKILHKRTSNEITKLLIRIIGMLDKEQLENMIAGYEYFNEDPFLAPEKRKRHNHLLPMLRKELKLVAKREKSEGN